MAHITPVTLATGVTLDCGQSDKVERRHYAFIVGGEEYPAAFARIRDGGITCYANPACQRPSETYPGKCGQLGL